MDRILICFLMCMALVGCTTSRSGSWNDRVGNYTYQQALKEMGRPGSEQKLPDGSIVAQWLVQRGQSASVGYGTDAQFDSPALGINPVPFETAATTNRYLRLTFGPDGRLMKWKRFYA